MGLQETSVACDAFNPVYWSHKDTQETIRQIVGNNAAGAKLCPGYEKWKKHNEAFNAAHAGK